MVQCLALLAHRKEVVLESRAGRLGPLEFSCSSSSCVGFCRELPFFLAVKGMQVRFIGNPTITCGQLEVYQFTPGITLHLHLSLPSLYANNT